MRIMNQQKLPVQFLILFRKISVIGTFVCVEEDSGKANMAQIKLQLTKHCIRVC